MNDLKRRMYTEFNYLTKSSTKHNGIMLPWQLCKKNMDHNKFSSFYNLQLSVLSDIFVHANILNAQTWQEFSLQLFQITRNLHVKEVSGFGFFFNVNQTVTIASNCCLSNKGGNNKQKLQNLMSARTYRFVFTLLHVYLGFFWIW